MTGLEVSQSGRVRTLTLARPTSLNAFDNQLYGSLAEGLRLANRDQSVAVVVVTGKGRAFSAGQDMAEMAEIGSAISGDDSALMDNPEVESGFPILLDELEHFTKPLVAAVNGLGVGLGFTMLAHCDLVLMANNAKLRVPFCPLGVAPEAASSVLFPDRMGWQNAAWTLFSGEWIQADEAIEMGIAWRLCKPESLLAEAHHVASLIARWPIPSLVATKSAMLAGRSDRVRQARKVEDAAFGTLMGTPANVEAVTAFLEKRDPDFTEIDGA